MKLSRHAFTTYWDVHAWAGVVLGLVLHLVFFFGAFALFVEPIQLWGEPLTQRSAPRAGPSLDLALRRVEQQAGPLPSEVRVYLPGNVGLPAVCFTEERSGAWSCTRVDPESGAMSRGGEQLSSFLFSLHYMNHPGLPLGTYLAGLASVGLLLVLVTGVLIHIKDIVRQFFQFRPQQLSRVAWSDAHKVLGVMGLPFQLAFALTGALLIFAPMLRDGMALAASWLAQDAVAAAAPAPSAPQAAPQVGAPLGLSSAVERARASLPSLTVRSLVLKQAEGRAQTIAVHGTLAGSVNRWATVELDARDGRVVHASDANAEPADAKVQRLLDGVHFASFGGLGLRLVFALLSLATCLAILSGNFVWLTRRERSRASLGNRLLARLTLGFGAGTCVATGVAFCASRCLPAVFGPRVLVEQTLFFVTWLACLLWALVVREPLRVWWQQLGLAAAAFVLAPCLASLGSGAGLLGSGPRIPEVVGVDLGLLFLGAALGATTWALLKAQRGPIPSLAAPELSPEAAP